VGGGRLSGLDGLRGLAALVVVVHHVLLTQPTLAAPYYDRQPVSGASWWVVHTPLHLLWAGTEAVYLFFVLSGFVLGLAAASPRFSWRAYLPARLLRLYLPVFGAVALGALVVTTLPRGSGASAWLSARSPGWSGLSVLRDLTLVSGTSRVISPLWSLQWEVVFSLLLAAFLSWGASTRPWLQVVVALVASTAGFQIRSDALSYLPLFAVGTALAQWWPTLRERLAPWSRSDLGWGLVVGAGLLLTCSYWLVLPFVPAETSFVATRPVTVVGVTVLVLAAAAWDPLAAVLSSRPLRFAGTISFSLYLVHEPIVIAAASAWPGSVGALVLAAAASLVVAAAFFLAVERPSHALARLVARRLGRGTAEAAPAEAAPAAAARPSPDDRR